MRRKNLMTALLCTVFMAMASVAPMTAMAEETEITTEAAEETEAVEAAETEAAEDETEAAAEEAAADTGKKVRPDYKALDYVTLGEYKGLAVTKGSSEVTDEEVDDRIQTMIKSSGEYESVKEGKVALGDVANIDYEGKKDDVAFAGGTAQGYDLGIGTGTFIPGFEEGLVGVEVGETVDIPLTFPENYGNSDLAGQDVIFTVTVNEIKKTPELSDDLAKKLTDGESETVESLRASVREDLEASKAEEVENQMFVDLFTQVVNVSEIKDYPQEVVDFNVNNLYEYYQTMATYYSMEFADFLSAYMGMTEEQFAEEAEAAVKENLQQEMYLKAIAENEQMEISDEEYAEQSKQFADMNGFETVEAFIAEYGEDSIRSSILQNKALDFLMESAVVADAEAETETEA